MKLWFAETLQSLRSGLRISCAVALLAAVTGCETMDGGGAIGAASGSSTAKPTETTPVQPAQADWIDRVQIGDMIIIAISEIPNPPPAFQLQVRTDGRITLLQNFEFAVAGKKRQEIEKEIENFYVREKEIYKRMTVSVGVPPRMFSIGGEVRQQGQVIHPGQMTVVKAIHAAGGFNDFANRRKVLVTRASDKSQITVDYKKAIRDPKFDVPIYPGDTIFVDKTIL